MNSETLQLYINSIQYYFSHCAYRLEENGEKNTLYWECRQKALIDGVEKDLATKDYLVPYSDFKRDFISNLDFFTNHLFKFYEKVYRYSLGGQPKSYLNSINSAFFHFQQGLKSFKYYKSALLYIKLEDPKSAHQIAQLIQFYFHKMLDDFMYYGIDLSKSPIGEDFDNIIKLLDGITSLSEIQIANEVTKTSKQETNKIETEYLEVKQLQKLNKANIDEVNTKHPHIFKNNAFEVWQSMYNSFEINESSRTDVKFMYEVMKKDGLIFKTVNQKIFLDWISQTYQIVIQKTSNYSKTPIRNNTYSNAKQLYKALDT